MLYEVITNALKILHGGWFPLLVAAAFFALMATWKDGRAILARRMTAGAVPLDKLSTLLEHDPPARVPGTAVFMAGNPSIVPPALLHNLKHNRVLHERVARITSYNVCYTKLLRVVSTASAAGVAAAGHELLGLLGGALGAGRKVVAEDEFLELLAAFPADVFKDGHVLTLRGIAEIRRQFADGLEEEVVHEIAEHVARGDVDLLV